jgi:hypothetical protein
LSVAFWLAVGLGIATMGRWRGHDPYGSALHGLVIGMAGAVVGGLVLQTWGDPDPAGLTWLNGLGAIGAGWAALVVYYAVEPPRALLAARPRRRRGRRLFPR